jgi:plasmid stabilization system protein ParE
MKFRLHRAAEREVAEAIEYYDAQQAGVGADFAGEVARGIRQVLDHPNAWQRVERGLRRYRLHRFPYGLVYQVMGNELVIVAVMHLSRDPGYWVDRI